MQNGYSVDVPSSDAAAWLKRCERDGLDAQTVKTHRSQVNNHILPRLGDRPLADLRRAVSLKLLLGEAVEREWIAASAAAGVKLKRQRRHAKRVEIPSKEEIRLLLKHLKPKHRALIVTAILHRHAHF